jgi:hypothetical protein
MTDVYSATSASHLLVKLVITTTKTTGFHEHTVRCRRPAMPSVRPAEPPVLPPALLKDVAGLYSKWKAVVQRTKYCTAHTADQFLIV